MDSLCFLFRQNIYLQNFHYRAFHTIPRRDSNGKDSGSLFRLEEFFLNTGLSPEKAKDLVKPVREVRLARQKTCSRITKKYYRQDICP
jgi:hypothetical protein